ncbi:FtsK/SpoIIIE family protein [Marvinbryantia formatexigens DSM 14469]|uniref:FtsK/SpoIIIE family protein n=1 Tax=Marvinbryantia formatexigens DSM 14469 TaxID=478749 RepID=C6LCE7_9FIRM|nr:DNA translocase FtsK 4TM domain-containing protein [Marvinbryantia formatexigens]EET61611.1 FtsK/SpoIIIE family protein [Marvinbryantia formatexigens DSM 14469]UWO24563.1 DNA translocase FtsK 4TM domain-containing protein [Marvinbryantia formatexigens DSM 14469]SDF13350.1 DNA segregation ATPase FtsK/SpoIIIE, S-DNA-T family [Marvinbryantia formatexigens]
METKNKKDMDSSKKPSGTKARAQKSSGSRTSEGSAKKGSAKKTDGSAKKGSAKKTDSSTGKGSAKKTGAAAKSGGAKSAGAASSERAGNSGTAGTRTAARRREIDVPDIRRAPGTPVFAEVFLWILIALCLILFLNNIFAFGVKALDTVSGFFFGVFGACAYLAPLLVVFLAAFIIANRASLPSWVKSGAIFIFFLCICAFTELLSGSFDGARVFSDYYAAGRDLRAGGGVAGGLLCRILCPVFGQVGAWILLIVLLIICAVIITERSLFDNLRRNGSRAYRRAKEDSRAKRQMHDLKKEKNKLQKQRRMQEEIERLRAGEDEEEIRLQVRRPRRANIVSGVMEDTRLDPHMPASEEIHEVVPRMSRQSDAARSRSASGQPERFSQADIFAQTGASVQTEKFAQTGEPMQAERHSQTGASMQAERHPQTGASMQAEQFSQTGSSAAPEEVQKPQELHFTIQRGDDAQENVIPAFSVADLGAGEDRSEEPSEMRESVPSAGEPADYEQEMPEVRSFQSRAAVRTQSLSPDTGDMPDTSQDTPAAATGAPEMPVGSRSLKNPKSSRAEQEKELDNVAQEIALSEEQPKPAYVFPPLSLLTKPARGRSGGSDREVRETAAKLQQTLRNFGVNVNVTNASCGPAVTRYELTPEQGVKVSRIVNLADDIKLNLAASDIRIEAPIPGKSAVGIEVPNKENSTVLLRELLESEEFKNAKSNLSFAVGKDLAGKVVVADIAKMPHLLIAGATGSGKSVCINTLIMSILYKADPEDVKLIMIDPKVVELSVYNGIPHLFIPVVTDPKKASGALNWGVAEMTDRYQKFAECGVRDLKGYNEKISQLTDIPEEQRPKKLPQIVIIVDELADLMMVAPGEVEDAICRLAQLARAAGIHLIIATQRPSVNVITGLIKANMPSRIAFSVSSGVDSRTIIDMNGAEKLLGKGDMLFYPQGYQKPVRVQGAFVSDKEVSNVTDFLTQKNDVSGYKQEMEDRMTQVAQASVSLPGASGGANELDSNFAEAGRFIIEKDKASIGMLQRVFKIGFNRAARIMDQLSEAGVVGPEEGTKPRKVLMTMEEFERYIDDYV